jgi:small-conductance mechanosensitive channel
MSEHLLAAWQHQPWMRLGATVVVVLVLALILHTVLRSLLWRASRSRPVAVDMLQRARAPMRWLVPLIVLAIIARASPDAQALGVTAPASHVLVIAMIAVATWLGVRCIGAIEASFTRRFPVDAADNLRARRVMTQVRVLARSATVVLVLLGAAAALMTVPGVRNVGASLLASAGLAGLVVGLAAKPVLSNLLAGLQIALAQPIRLDDVVIIEGEWGRIEEITGTYVVVRIWDQRRLVVPLNWFIENPFQNWTRNNAELIGTVYLWLDYRVPMEPLRAELQRLCEATPKWDGRVCVLQVTDANERAVQVRALVSSPDSGTSWDARCFVREGLIAYVQRRYPGALPRWRGELFRSAESEFASGAPGTTPPPQHSPTAEDGGPRAAHPADGPDPAQAGE